MVQHSITTAFSAGILVSGTIAHLMICERTDDECHIQSFIPYKSDNRKIEENRHLYVKRMRKKIRRRKRRDGSNTGMLRMEIIGEAAFNQQERVACTVDYPGLF